MENNMKFRELIEARDKSVSSEFRIALGKLKGIYGDDETPSIKDLEKDAEMVAKKAKIQDVKGFVKYAKTQITQVIATGKMDEANEFEKSEVYKQFNTVMSEVYKFGDMWKTKELEKSLDRKKFNELRTLHFDATQNLAKLADLLKELSVKDVNESAKEVNEASDMDIVKKVSKKALGGNVNKVVDQGDGYYTINVAGSVVPWDDFKSLEINLSSFEIDNVDFDDNDILIKKK